MTEHTLQKTQVFDRQMKDGRMLISGSITLYAIQATRENDDGGVSRPFFAREGRDPWTDSIQHAELWSSLGDVRAVIGDVEWECMVEPVSVKLFIGKVASV